MIPRRLRTWIFVWTPVSWLLLSLITYPKDRPLSSGAATIVKPISMRPLNDLGRGNRMAGILA